MTDIAVLGGSSVSTPALIEALGRVALGGRLPPIVLWLHGRRRARLEAVARYGRNQLQELGVSDRISVSASTEVDRVLNGADLVLCQVRPGGFEGRARDERLALDHGIPGDEGLGPGGLGCYLHGLPAMDVLHAAVARHAPHARLLHMTSPLGLNVARARTVFGLDCVGICELPTATIECIRACVEPALGVRDLRVLHAGTNHQGWLHHFTDPEGRDRTPEVLEAIEDPELVRVDPDLIRREGAVPLPYMRLYYHPERELQTQRSAAHTRGEELRRWADDLQAAYLSSGPVGADRVKALLARRRLHWYRQGTVPAIVAFLGRDCTAIPLNLPGRGALPGVPPEAIVELPCRASRRGAEPRPVPPLPSRPAELNRQIITFEAAVLDLPDAPDQEAIAACLALHPMVTKRSTARAIAGDLARSLPDGSSCASSS